MVSLVKLSEVTEDGVKFQSPHDQTEMLLTPEKSIEIQNAIGQNLMIIEEEGETERERFCFVVGADIIMQLDDVVSSTISGPRVEEAMWRFGGTSFVALDILLVQITAMARSLSLCALSCR